MSLTAVLCETKNFVYLDLADGIIDAFIELIKRRDVKKPEEASDDDYVGAHISVMRPDEYLRVTKGRKRIKEIGEEFDYTIEKLYVTEPNWGDVQECYFISVKSPQLEALRKKYGLSKKINGHDFHISVGVRLSKLGK